MTSRMCACKRNHTTENADTNKDVMKALLNCENRAIKIALKALRNSDLFHSLAAGVSAVISHTMFFHCSRLMFERCRNGLRLVVILKCDLDHDYVTSKSPDTEHDEEVAGVVTISMSG